MEKDKNQVIKIARECARDYSLLKNSGVDQTAIPPRQWIRAWMQTHYNIIKLSGYFYRELAKALDAKSSHNSQDINEDISLGFSKKVGKKYSRKTSDDAVNEIALVDNIDDMLVWFKRFFKYHNTVKKEEKIENDTNIYWKIEFKKIWKNKKVYKLGEIFLYREYKNSRGLPTNVLSFFCYDKAFDSFMSANHQELIQKPGNQSFLPQYGNANGDHLLIPIEAIKILADYYNEKIERILGTTLDDKSSPRSNDINEDISLGLSKKVDKKYTRKTSDDVVNELSLVDNIDDMIKLFERFFKYCDKTVENTRKVENKSNSYWTIKFRKIGNKKDRLEEIFFYREYRNSSGKPTNILSLFSYDRDFDLFMAENHPELILQKPDENSLPLYGNVSGGDPLLMPVGTIKILADYYNKKAERLLGISESMSLGLGNKVKKVYSNKNSVENLGDQTCKALFEKIKKIFENNGFTDDSYHKIVESSMVSVPTGYFKYTVNEYEDSIIYKGEEMFYSFYQVFVYIDNDFELTYSDNSHFILEIRINPDIENNNKESSKRVMIGTDMYDDIGWMGVRLDNKIIVQNLKNSVPVKKENETNDSMIDTSSPEKVKAFLADIEGIAKTLAAYQEDRKSGNLKLTDVYHEQSSIESYSRAIWKYLKKYFWKNSVAVNGTLQEGLGNKVKKKFDKIDAVDNVTQIQFEDPEIKRICHAHGVYTVDDAARVTNIKLWFVANENIKSFNELQFFIGLKTIEDKTFSDCSALQSITIPSSVTSIGVEAFTQCETLQSITIPDSVTNIGDDAFWDCRALQSITIPDSVTNIGDDAFTYCDTLQSINIPDTVISIGHNPFWNCDALQSIYISKDCPVYNKIKNQYPDIRLIEPKVNESTNLGLNKYVQDKFKKKDILEDFDEFVDLGIPSGVRWAKHNVGATTEEEYGDYYSYKDIDKLSRGNVRVPTNIEWSDLKRYCTIEFVTSGDGKKGLVARSKEDPSKYIFLPSAGFARTGKVKSIVATGINGAYMLSNIYRYAFHFNSDTNSVDFQSFFDFDICRFTVRMVEYPEKKKKSKKIEESSHLGLNKRVQKNYEKKDATVNVSRYVDLGLPSGNLWCKYNVGAYSEEEYGDYFKHHQALAIDTKEGVLPLSSDFLELRQHCEETDETINGVKCRVFTSKQNGERLCFPAAGLNGVNKNMSGSYWAKETYEESDNRSCCMTFSHRHKAFNDNFNNANELSVRLVLKKDKVNESSASLGLNKHVQKKLEDKDSVENVSLIPFKDKEVEKVCHEHGVYTFGDAASVTTIIDETQWFKPSWFYDHKIKTFDEFKYFTGLKMVERFAFNFNTTLESITLPSSIETIGFAAFKDCHNLVKVTIQEGLKTIKTCAFVNCRHLETLVLPEGLEEIESLVIEGCSNIKSVNIPDSAKYIDPTAFNECGESLNTIYISSNHQLRSALSKNCPHVVLVDPKEVNESNLGLNKHVQKKFQDIDDIENLEFDYVDLGLPSGTLWCRHNYGATSEEESGEKQTFDEAQNLDVDVPSKEDFVELNNNCDCKVENVNGIYGIRFVSKKNGRTIFLPIGSSKNNIYIGGEKYWSSTEFSSESGYNLSIYHDYIDPTNYNSKFFKYSVRPVKRVVKESSLGLNSKVKKKFEGDNEGDKALDQVRPVFDCVDDSGKPVEVHMSDVDWKNKVFKWLYDNVDTLKIKEDDEYRAKRGHTILKVDDFITNKYSGQISICLYHHEYSSYGHPSYIDRLAEYFNGNPNFPLILTAHDLGNYSFCAVKLWKQGTKWRLTSEAYYQDKYYRSKRCPNGAWKTAKKTVTSKDCPILLKIK